MSTTTLIPTARPAFRIGAANANHHLWNNHGTWFIHYTVYPTPYTKERVRRSLGTRDLPTALERRDAVLAHLAAQAAGAAPPGNGDTAEAATTHSSRFVPAPKFAAA